MTVTEQRAPGSLWRDHAFRRLFAAAAVSNLGTQISFVAMPLVAVVVLNATPGQVGLLGVLEVISFLLIGLPAGAWLDRTGKRRVMVAADAVRAALLASVPAAWALDVLSMGQLYLVALLTGAATVFFEVGTRSYLPSVVGRDRLVDANSKLGSMDAASTVAGPSVAGFLVQLTAAPVAVAVDALTYLWSALWLAGVRRPEPQPPRSPDRRLLRDIGEGIRFVFRHPLLRPIALAGALTNLFLVCAITTVPLVLVRAIGLPPSSVGLFFTFGGLGVFLGAATAGWVCARLGHGRSLWILGLAGVPLTFLVPLVDTGAWQWIASVAWLAQTFRVGQNNVVLMSYRQRATPDRLLSRMNATMQFLMRGALAVGAALAGVVGSTFGVRAALWVAAVGLAVAWVPILFSPLRGMRTLDGPEEDNDD